MPVMVIQHKIRDYDAWRPVYDAHQASRTGAGVTNGRVYRKAEDPNDILVVHDVADLAKARTWTEGEDLRAAMKRSGVVSKPVIYFSGKSGHRRRRIGGARVASRIALASDVAQALRYGQAGLVSA